MRYIWGGGGMKVCVMAKITFVRKKARVSIQYVLNTIVRVYVS